MKDLNLVKFEANSFMGIDTSNPVVIDFTEARKGQGVTKLKGDQGVGKTSTMHALMYLMGAAFNFDAKNLVNKVDKDVSAKLEFEYEGNEYYVEASGNRVVLKQKINSGKFVTMGEPKTWLRTIFGNLGVSPMFLRDLDGKKQIQWFKETFGSDEEVSKKEKRITEDYKKTFDQRRDLNRDIKNLKGALAVNPLNQNYEKSAEKFKKPIDSKKEKDALDALQTKMQEYNRAKDGLDQLKRNQKSYAEQIVEMERRLNELRKSHEEVSAKIENGNKYLEDNKKVEKEFQAANEAWLNLSKTLAEQEKWKQLQKDLKNLDDWEQTAQKATDTIEKLRTELKKLTKTYLPDIEGLEIRVKVGLDDEDEGIFYQDKSLAQLSESELWDLFFMIWEDKDVRFVYCENVNALGSEAVKTMNRLVKEKKAQIFASEMERGKKELQVSFSTKVE